MGKMFTIRNILIIVLLLVIILFIAVRLSSDLSLSTLVEKYAPIDIPGVHDKEFYKTMGENEIDVFAYVNHHSVQSGKPFKLFLSTNKYKNLINGAVEISRVGYYKNSDRKIVYKSGSISVLNQDISVSSFAAGAAWKPLDNYISTNGWKSGYYAIDFVESDGKRIKDIAYIVVTDPQNNGDILIKLSTNTYQAYNQWGGSSLYGSETGLHADIVSFDRPTKSQFYDWEYYYVVWVEQFAEKHNLKIDYATNYDFYANPDIANNYALLMSLGHDEYWSQEEFDAYYNRIFKQGKNTMFLSGNTAYWRVRYGDLHSSGEGRQLICYKNSLIKEGEMGKRNFDPITFTKQGALKSTGLFRGAIGFPENRLMGVGYESYFKDKNLRFTYKVKNIIPWIFEGTNLKIGDKLADVIGYEWDNTSLFYQDIPGLTEYNAHIPMIDRERLHILFEGDVIDAQGKPGHAQAVYFETDAGAKVFSAGTIRWAWGVGKPGFIDEQFQKINENLIIGLIKNHDP